MNVAKFSVQRPVAVTMRIASLVLLGFICLLKLPIDLLPKVTLPTVAVSVNWPNVAPEQMETQIARRIEEAVSSVPNMYHVSSSSTLGSARVTIQFNWGTDIGQAAVDTLQLVQRAQRSFPNDPNLSAPTVFKYDPNSAPILVYGVSGVDDPVKLRTLLDNDITPMIENADGVASATVSGGLSRAIMVNVDPVKIQAYGMTLDQVQKRIVQENVSVPAGIAKQGETEYTIISNGYFTSPDQIKDIVLGVSSGKLITLGMVAQVLDSNTEQRLSTRLEGAPAVGLTIVKQSDANTVDTANAVYEKLEQVKKRYPQLKFSEAYNQSQFIENSIHDLRDTAIIGGTLAIIILMFFLRNLRSTIVVALSIPISIVSTFALIYFCGFTLNTISLSGLALATGLIVDDAVVVLENIFRHIERDKRSAMEASVTGTQEIVSAVLASTITVIVVFLPLFMIKGQSGQTFSQFALVVIFSIAVSLLDATTVVPMLASRLIKVEEVEEEAHPELRKLRGKKESVLTMAFDWFGRKFNAMDASYRKSLEWAIHHRIKVAIAAAAVTGASLLLVPYIGTEMMPQTDTGDVQLSLKLKVGTAYSKTDEIMKQVEMILLKNPNVQTVFSGSGTNVGFRGAGGGVSYQGGAIIHLRADRKQSTGDVVRDLQKQLSGIPGARINITPYDLVTQILTGGSSNMEVDLFGSNAKLLLNKGKEVVEALRGIPGLTGVDIGLQDATPELHWEVDRPKALMLGITFADVANAINTATSGDLASYYQENGFQYPIYVQVPESLRKSAESMAQLPITPSIKVDSASTSKPVLLGQIAKPTIVMGPNEITRLDRQRYVSVTGRVQDRPESEVQEAISKAMSKIEMPQGTYWDFGINQKRRGEEFSGLGLAIFLAIVLIYMLLASQFESFIYPLIVLTSVPLCAIGVILALFLTGKSFGLTAFIGLLMLIGIVVKNGILLVDYTNQLRGRGMARDEAILTASPTRLRPILMTSSAAILGMLPLAMGIGKGSETQAPLATAVVGGLTTSTLLTLFIVPIVYTMFDDIARRFRKDPRDLASAGVGPGVGALETEETKHNV